VTQSGGTPESIPRNAAYQFAIQVSTASFTAVLTIFLARKLGPDDFGVFSLAIGIGSIVALVSDLGVSHSVARFVAERRSELGAVAKLVADAVRLKVVLAGVVSLLMALLAGPVADAYHEPALAWTLRAMAIAVFGQGMVTFFSSVFSGLARTSASFRMVFAESAVETGASIAIVLAGAGAAGAALGRGIGYVVGAALGGFTMARLLSRRKRSQDEAPGVGMRRIVRYASAILVIEGAFVLFTQIDVLVIGAVLSASAVGLFQAPLRLITILGYPGFSLAGGVAPRMATDSAEGPRVDAFTRSLRYLLILQAAMVPPILVWAGPIVQVTLGSAYGESADVLRALAPFVFLSGFAPLLSLSVNYMGEARLRVPIAIVTVLINFGIDVVLIPKIGIVGGAVGTNVAYAIYVPAHLWVCKRMIDVPLRPLAITGARTAVAAALMAGVLVLFGTSDVAVPMLVLGALGGVLVYLAALVGLRELSPGEVRAGGRFIRRLVPGGSA
jgi:O-antigen/teichoic acid export membrane protein